MSLCCLLFLILTDKIAYDVIRHKFAGDPMFDLGLRIRELRQQRNMTQSELAEAIGVRQESINRMEKGKYNPSFEVLQNMCSIFGITLSEFFATQSNQLPPDMLQLLETAKRLTPEERRKLTDLIQTLLDRR
jgi:DNA-binding XRE family transcriptional regulator